jgi:acyl carrier protein
VREQFRLIPKLSGMTTKDIHSVLRGYIKLVNPRATRGLPPESDFRYDWHLDSLDLVQFVAHIELKFKIMIPDEDLPKLVSLVATEQYIRARLSS